MTQTDSPYIVHTYSRLPAFVDVNDLPEARVIEEAAKLETEWSRAVDGEDAITYDESSTAFRNKLADSNSVLVLVEDQRTGDMVGFGEMTNEAKGPLFTLAYVRPEHRRRVTLAETGVLDIITEAISDAGMRAGYDAILAEPRPEARGVLRRHEFFNIGEGPNQIILKKILRGTTGEGNGSTPPGMPPRSKR